MSVFAPYQLVVGNLFEYMSIVGVKAVLVRIQRDRMYVVSIYGLVDE